MQPGALADLTVCDELDTRDYFRLEPNGPTFVDARAWRDDGAGVTLSLVDTAGRPVGIGAAGPEYVGRFGLVQAPGDYFVVVESTGDRAAYDLTVETERPGACEFGDTPDCFPCLDAMDPNDDRATARPIGLGHRYRGLAVCEGVDDHDVFAFTVDGPTSIHAELATVEEWGRITFLLTDGAGNLLTNRGQGRDGVMWKDAELARAGTYYVEVRADPGVGAYELLVTER